MKILMNRRCVSIWSSILPEGFRQMNVFSAETEYDVKISQKGKLAVHKRPGKNQAIRIEGNNRKKKIYSG